MLELMDRIFMQEVYAKNETICINVPIYLLTLDISDDKQKNNNLNLILILMSQSYVLLSC